MLDYCDWNRIKIKIFSWPCIAMFSWGRRIVRWLGHHVFLHAFDFILIGLEIGICVPETLFLLCPVYNPIRDQVSDFHSGLYFSCELCGLSFTLDKVYSWCEISLLGSILSSVIDDSMVHRKKSCVRCVCDEVQIIVGRTGHKAEGYWHKAATISVAKYLNDAITCGNRTLLLSSQQNRYVVNSDNLQLHLVNAELSFCVAPHLTKQLLCTPQLITNSLPTIQG